MAFLQQLRDLFEAHDDNRQIDFGRQFTQSGITFQAENFFTAQGNRIDFALIFMVDQAIGDDIADFPRRC